MNNPIVYITRRVVFSAAHRLHSAALSEDENKTIYDKCNHPSGHGHNYVLHVSLRGPADPKTGMLINLADLKVILDQYVLSEFDHRFINKDIPYFESVPPTVETMVVYIWNLLKPHLGDLLYELKLEETENNVGIYRGETD
tara:strand:+ start:17 stop:439 length:423 start_codon:yes stop_codon:yes gene_type:complete